MPQDRSKDRHKPRATIADMEDEWRELGEVVGDGNRSEVVRQLVRAFLKRPGAKIPRRSDYEPKPE